MCEDVQKSVCGFIKRVAKGGAQAEEVNVFPQVLLIYIEKYGQNTISIAPSSLDIIKEIGAQQSAGFPQTGYVNAQQVAEFLGYSKDTHKRPEKAAYRLSNEGLIPKPETVGDKTQRWRAEDIWAYYKRTKESAA